MPAVRDPTHPRAFVKPLPLPIESQVGLKLQRRDSLFLNPELPTRDEVRRSNYERRKNQMATMGFKSASHKPYMGIGDPFYLDQKKLILHALGQWNEEDQETSSSSDESEEEDDKSKPKSKPSFAVAKFVLRRSRKDLNTINKAVVHGRGMIRNVQLGHSLFDIINKEKERKKEASELELKKKRELQRNEFQPPKMDSEDETDDELENDVDLTNYMVPLAPPTFLTQPPGGDTDEELGILEDETGSDQSPEREPEIVTFSGMALAEDEEEWQRSRSAAVTSEMTAFSRPESVRKKKQQTPRPYTPQHTNLSTNLSVKETEEGEEELDISRDALFRQLCVLHWILEAMSTDPPSAMSPITSCWSLSDIYMGGVNMLDIGGSKPQPTKLKRDKNIETSWSNFLSRGSPGKAYATQRVHIISPAPNSSAKKPKVGKRMSTQRSSKTPHGRRAAINLSRNSLTPSAAGGRESITGSSNLVSQLPSTLLKYRGGGDDPDHPPTPHSEDSDQLVSKSIFKFLDEYYESLKREEEIAQERDGKSPSPTPSTTSAQDQKQKKEKRHKSKEDRERKTSKKKKEESDQPKRLDHKVAVALGEEEKMSSKFLRANAHLIRPKSSSALLEFQSLLPSNRHSHLCAKLHNQFAEAREEKACTMHDILDHKEKQMMSVCQSKFMALQNTTHGSSFHRAVDDMRHTSYQRLRKPMMDRRKTTAKGNWYMDIVEKIPHELKQEWHYAKILEKLGKYGLVEGTGKQTIYKFLRVLEGLREWEICSPDVTAAIEFCRERIVEMTVEEYEWWFKERFPKVTRPQTAPPSSKTEKKDVIENSQNIAPNRAVQSAFTRRVQR